MINYLKTALTKSSQITAEPGRRWDYQQMNLENKLWDYEAAAFCTQAKNNFQEEKTFSWDVRHWWPSKWYMAEQNPCHWMRRGRYNHSMVLFVEAARTWQEPKNIHFFLIDEHTIIWRIRIVERQSQSKIKQILQVTEEKAFNLRFTRHWWPSKWYMAEQNPCHWWRPPFCG